MPKDSNTGGADILRFQVNGLSCAGCVGRSERAMAAVDGVESVAVNLANKQATVTFDAPAKAVDILAATAKAGYPADTETLQIEVQGATCATCVGRIEAALKAVPGVIEAAMNLANGRATVRVYTGQVDRADLARAVEGAGYSAVASGAEAKVGAQDRAKQEIARLRLMLILSAGLTLPVFVAEMGGHLFPPIHHFIVGTIGLQSFYYLQFLFTTLVLAGPGRMFFTKGLPALLRGAPDMNSLVALGSGAAWIYSTVTTFAPSLLPDGSRNVYFESAAMIVTLILLGRFLEAGAKGRTGDAVRGLLALTPDMALVERDGQVVELPVDQVRAGDTLHLKPGARLAVDGVVLSGASFVDESMITGEPVPVEKTQGAPVTGGTVNGTGALSYRATKVGRDTVLARIVAMVEAAQGAKLPIQGLVDKITLWFVPVVMGLAALTCVTWLSFGPAPALTYGLVAGVAVLIIACPCAMGLATPTSIMVGTGRAAELGVLFRKGDALQRLQDIGVVALDKTGTLTEGHPELTDFVVADGQDEGPVLSLLAAVENQSEHPIARAIVAAAKARGLTWPEVKEFKSLTGNGVRATVDGHVVLIGADRLMEAEGLDPGPMAGMGANLATAGKTPLYGAIDGQVVCVVAVSDPIKPTSRAAITALHDMGIKVAMLTGDNAATAQAIADQLGIDQIEAEVLPKGKAEAIKALRQGGKGVAFVGDGINDAPALAEADVGLAVGTGTDIAIETADVVLMSGDLRGVINAFEISRHTMGNIRQNLFWAFGYNVVLIPVAMGLFYPFFGTLLSPTLAAGAMAMSSVFVVTNALRLRFVKPAMGETP